jgi:uncharacterized membrane protein YgcG
VTNLDPAPTTRLDDTAPAPLVDVDSITPDQTLLADVQRTRITTPLTRVLLTLVVLSAVFLAGALVERTQHKSSSSASGIGALAAQLRNRFGGQGASGATGATGALGGFGGGNGTTIGTVKLVDGKNVYVQDFSGNVVKVTTNASTAVNLTTKSTVSKLKPGTSVIVQGTASSDGTSTAATSISQSTGFGNGNGSPFGGGGGRG